MGWAIQPTFILMWQRVGKSKMPAVTFTPDYPGQRFNHEAKRPQWIKKMIHCPCGTTDFSAKRQQDGEHFTIATCPLCQSWHSIKWMALPHGKRSGFIHC